MQPMAVDRDSARTELAFPAKYGQHTRDILAEAGLDNTEIDTLAEQGVVTVMANTKIRVDA